MRAVVDADGEDLVRNDWMEEPYVGHGVVRPCRLGERTPRLGRRYESVRAGWSGVADDPVEQRADPGLAVGREEPHRFQDPPPNRSPRIATMICWHGRGRQAGSDSQCQPPRRAGRLDE